MWISEGARPGELPGRGVAAYQSRNWDTAKSKFLRLLESKPGDRACQSDLDCASVSDTARCDVGMHARGEIYQRCAPAAGRHPLPACPGRAWRARRASSVCC